MQATPNRRAILASGSGHYIYRSNPKLAIDAIVEQYLQVNAHQAKSHKRQAPAVNDRG
ncbi:MAG TPA: hypothetical protein VKZ53_26130 [Candidatus Angelobacter sp.]|nr:hypothetical protein [Candidatus Angelobacter sp.]